MHKRRRREEVEERTVTTTKHRGVACFTAPTKYQRCDAEKKQVAIWRLVLRGVV